MQQQHDSIRTAPVRVVNTHSPCLPDPAPAHCVSRRPIYRPLIIGPAILHRHAEPLAGTSPIGEGRSQPWQVNLVAGSRLRPRVPPSLSGIEATVARCRRAGRLTRIGAALVSCCDIISATATLAADGPAGNPLPHPRFRFDDPRRGVVAEIYGWALMYQMQGMIDRAVIDAHDEFDDLPAYYESPLELVDRSAFLAARGIPSRPIALLTRPHDFAPAAVDGAGPVSIHFPQTRFRRPADLHRIF